MGSQLFNSHGSFTWTCPPDVFVVQVEVWGSGGTGGGASFGITTFGGGGGGGGAYAKRIAASVVPGNTYAVVVGQQGSTTPSSFGTGVCVADYGRNGGNASGGVNGAGGAGGRAVNSIGDITVNGAAGATPTIYESGPDVWDGGNGGASAGGAAGGTGGTYSAIQTAGAAPGGGGGAGSNTGGAVYSSGAPGGDGQVLITWYDPIYGTTSCSTGVASSDSGWAAMLGAVAGAARISESYDGGNFTAQVADEVTISSSVAGTVTIYGTVNCSVSVRSYAQAPNLAAFQYYLDLFTSEYRASTRLLAWANANIQLFQDVLFCIRELMSAWDLDLAVGVQLDTIGLWVGASRTLPFQPSGGVSPILDDASYRILLRAKIAQNHWDGTLDGLLRSWQAIFPNGLLVVNDHQDMTVDLYVAAPFSSVVQDMVLNGLIVPRPQGVLYTISVAALPMLGFDRGDSFVAGFDTGKFTGA